MDPIYLDGSSTSGPYDQIEIDDDEEDQLASDIDEQRPADSTPAPDGEELEPDPDDEDAREGGHPQNSTTPNGKRKHQRKSGERVPGHTLVPATRLENILRADGMRPRRIVSRPPSSQFLQERVVQCRKRRNLLCQSQQYVPHCNSISRLTRSFAGRVYQMFH
jgi:hypothetical protein